jgi:dTDP-4-amino-4,6-dideoxygalactose transaminase
LTVLGEYTARRRQIARMYRAGLDNPAIRLLSAPAEESNHVYHLFVVRCEQRERLAEHLSSCGIESLIHYPIPVHQQQPCIGLPRDPQGLRAAESHAGSCLSIPCNPQLTDEEVWTVIRALNEFR